jgi:hypothetical protein
MVKPADVGAVWTPVGQSQGATVETLVEAFHSGFHNTPENTVTAKP